MRTHSSWTLLLVSALAIPTPFGFGQAAAAQQSPASSAPAQSSAVLHVTANLVLVDVVVTEKGKAVHGLDRSKFHLFEDGREQTIVNFDEHRPAAVPAALPALPVLPPHTYNNVPAYPATGVVNVLLLDGLNTPATDQIRARQQMIEYLVDARGIMTLQPFQASNMTSGPMDGIRDGILDQTGNNEAFMGRIVSEQTSMRQIAEQTGGEAFINTNGLKEAVASAVENGESYYTIAYTPAAKKFDSQFHKIQVRLDASGDKLSYRRGYYADSQDKSPLRGPGSKDLVAAATLQGAPPATQILFLTRVLPAGDPQIGGIKPPEGPAGEMSATMKGPKRRYIVDVQIDPRTLDFVQGPEGRHQAEFDCALIAYNAEGKRLNYADRSFSIAPKADQYKGILASGLPVRLALDLPAGEEFLRIAVHDKTVDHAGSLEIPLMVTAE